MSEILIRQLSKTYGTQTVLDKISAEFFSGKIYGLVGRNGSGKTMLLKHICGFVTPDSGEVLVNGERVGKKGKFPENIGIIIESPGFLPSFTGFQNLKILARVKGNITDREIKDSIRLVGLDPESGKKVGKYSMGMRQRLGLAQALMEDPDILLLDEPTNGLDNEGVKDIREILYQKRKEGKLIILASHSREDIELLCDEVGYMDRGEMKEWRTLSH